MLLGVQLAVLIDLPAALRKFLLRLAETRFEIWVDGVKILFELLPAVAQHPFRGLYFIQVQ